MGCFHMPLDVNSGFESETFTQTVSNTNINKTPQEKITASITALVKSFAWTLLSLCQLRQFKTIQLTKSLKLFEKLIYFWKQKYELGANIVRFLP